MDFKKINNNTYSVSKNEKVLEEVKKIMDSIKKPYEESIVKTLDIIYDEIEDKILSVKVGNEFYKKHYKELENNISCNIKFPKTDKTLTISVSVTKVEGNKEKIISGILAV